MPGQSPGSTPILYQNHDNTVILIDLPGSIEDAQSVDHSEALETQLLSCAALEQPYISTEPKSDRARANLLAHQSSHSVDEHHIEEAIDKALDGIRDQYAGSWCSKRWTESARIQQSRKRRSKDVDETSNEAGSKTEPSLDFATEHSVKSPWILARTQAENIVQETSGLAQRLVTNSNPFLSTIRIASINESYLIPANTSFYLDWIDDRSARKWSAAMMKSLAEPTASAGPGQFDLVVLDPPWHNRSARRSRAYATDHRNVPWLAIKAILSRHLAPEAYVACWITNREACRAEAMKAFDEWGMCLVEEWVWIKTTAHGEPVTDLHGLWRKPFEILLIARRCAITHEVDQSGHSLRRHVIAAVPDWHSRKPCLKARLEENLGLSADYRALEIFARYLTAGWSAWGNEAIRFNWKDLWREKPSDDIVRKAERAE